MTRDEIIRMAREADLLVTTPIPDDSVFVADLVRFAALVAAAEREACAQICEAFDDDGGAGEAWALRFAQVVRARSET